MKLYAGIDLHSNNSVVVVIDETDRVIYQRRMSNDLSMIVGALNASGDIDAVAVESTFNWYWLVDGLQAAGFDVRLVNTTAVKQYDGLKHGGDSSDARHLAQLLRLGILPEGYIYPREERAVRDLLRKRHQLVRQRSTQILSIQNQLARNLNTTAAAHRIKQWQADEVSRFELLPEQALALAANVQVMQCLNERIAVLEREILLRAKPRKDFEMLQSVSGVGKVLALTIALETGDIHRFAAAGHFASYARTVASRRESNGKKKGEGNRRCGNRHLAWAFVEAANAAIRYNERIGRYYQKKKARTLPVVAIKAVAHKLARASYHVMKTGEPFDVGRAFG